MKIKWLNPIDYSQVMSNQEAVDFTRQIKDAQAATKHSIEKTKARMTYPA